jgi:tetratricopeptide (TPR) repeat protein
MAKRSKKKKSSPGVSQGNTAAAKAMVPGKSSVVPWAIFVQALVIAAAVLWIYWPALHGDWLWDDDVDITDNTIIQSPTGLWSIWFEPYRQIDYYPIKSSVQWFQWHLWGLDTLGYHLTNVLLHILSALLIWRLLSKFGLRLAWLGGLIFAVHPVQVESVAWIVELKNTLSLPPFLLAMCAWIDFEDHGKARDYGRALGLFGVAMLCKLSVVLFPLVILLYGWWRRGRLGWNDLKTSAPFFGVCLVLGMVTIFAGVYDARFNHPEPGAMPVGGLLARLISVGLSLSFCFSKALLPVGLLPIYPKWTVDASSPMQFLPWLVLGGVIGWLWTRRQSWGRHALLGLGFFLINLGPCPGFIPAPDMAFTWVMNHFLYLPIIGLIGLVVAALEQAENRLSTSLRFCGGGLVIVVLACLVGESRSYAKLYLNTETLWTYELQYDQGAWMAHGNLGHALAKTGRVAGAIAQFEQALRIKPDDARTHYNLGNLLSQTGRLPEAMAEFEEALRIDPDYAEAHNNLGEVLWREGRIPDAFAQYQQALQIKPGYAEAHNNLGNALLQTGHVPEAMDQYKLALSLKPDFAEARNNLGLALFKTGEAPEAIEQYRQALRSDPDNAGAHYNLGNALQQIGQMPEAMEQYQQAVLLKPDYAEALNNLGLALSQAGRRSEAMERYQQALSINPDYAEAHNNLGGALAQTGRLTEAKQQFEEALRLKPDFAAARDNLARVQALQKVVPAKN